MAATTHELEAGDAVYFDANTIHSYVCCGDEPATAVIVTLQHPLMVSRTERVRGVTAAMLRPVLEKGAPEREHHRMH